jgi:lipopolysaccharide export system permease protein
VEWHRKWSFSAICLVMFLIGAPLGAIIRRGGLGFPLLFGIIFFVVYFILFTMGEKNANAGVLSPFAGMWLPVYTMLPLGVYFVYKARKDADVFNKEFLLRLWNRLRSHIQHIKSAWRKILAFKTN